MSYTTFDINWNAFKLQNEKLKQLYVNHHIDVPLKTCARCHKKKMLVFFYKRDNKNGRHDNTCSECYQKQARDKRRKTKDRLMGIKTEGD